MPHRPVPLSQSRYRTTANTICRSLSAGPGSTKPDDRRIGWYNVKAGESKTFTFNDAQYALTAQDFGYYAMGGGKVWTGRRMTSVPLPVIIHPKQAFKGSPEDSIDGGRKYFRHIKLKETSDDKVNGSATLTFNP